MPNRILREGILDSKAIDSLSEDAEFFYRRLMSVVDDFGRYEADPELLQIKCFPRARRREEWTIARITKALSEVGNCNQSDGHMTVMGQSHDGHMTVMGQSHDGHMTVMGQSHDGHALVTLYTVLGKRYLQINNFQQRMRAKHSKCPSPDGHMTVMGQSHDGHMTAEAKTKTNSEAEANAKTNANSEAAIFGSLDHRKPDSIEPEEFQETVAAIIKAHPKYHGVKTELVRQNISSAVFSLPANEQRELLLEIKRQHALAVKTEKWTKNGGKFSESLHAWIARRGWQDELPEEADDYESQIPSRGPAF